VSTSSRAQICEKQDAALEESLRNSRSVPRRASPCARLHAAFSRFLRFLFSATITREPDRKLISCEKGTATCLQRTAQSGCADRCDDNASPDGSVFLLQELAKTLTSSSNRTIAQLLTGLSHCTAKGLVPQTSLNRLGMPQNVHRRYPRSSEQPSMQRAYTCGYAKISSTSSPMFFTKYPVIASGGTSCPT
jgi:hypothetical protein